MTDDEQIIAALPPAPPPPADLADRVLARLHAAPRRRLPAGELLAVALLVLLVVLAPRRHDGAAVLAERTSLTLGGRGVAVAEAGAALAWRVTPGGAARVEQQAGRVFYRVEPGGPFVVATPAGEVRVTGTCFSVEVSMKATKQPIVAGALGAALATAVVVSVYEGRVILASSHGQRTTTSVGAGETARLDAPPPASPPTRAPAPAQAAASALAAAAAHEDAGASPDEVVALRTRVEQLEKQLVHAREKIAEAARERGEPSRVSPTAEDLQAWARRCEIHIDAPSVWNSTPDALTPQRVEEWGLLKDEVPIVDRAQADAHARALAQLRRIYLVATGDAPGADQLAPGALFGEIMDKADPATLAEARRRMALERAGLAPVPPDLTTRPPAEQALRMVQSLGAELESQLAAQLGPTRAHELRERYNGWPGLRMDNGGCEAR